MEDAIGSTKRSAGCTARRKGETKPISIGKGEETREPNRLTHSKDDQQRGQSRQQKLHVTQGAPGTRPRIETSWVEHRHACSGSETGRQSPGHRERRRWETHQQRERAREHFGAARNVHLVIIQGAAGIEDNEDGRDKQVRDAEFASTTKRTRDVRREPRRTRVIFVNDNSQFSKPGESSMDVRSQKSTRYGVVGPDDFTVDGTRLDCAVGKNMCGRSADPGACVPLLMIFLNDS